MPGKFSRISAISTRWRYVRVPLNFSNNLIIILLLFLDKNKTNPIKQKYSKKGNELFTDKEPTNFSV